MKWPIAAAAALAAVRISRITAGHIVYYIQYETAIGLPQLSRENLSVAQRCNVYGNQKYCRGYDSLRLLK